MQKKYKNSNLQQILDFDDSATKIIPWTSEID